MKRYQIWNGTDSIITPSGAQFTAQEWGGQVPLGAGTGGQDDHHHAPHQRRVRRIL